MLSDETDFVEREELPMWKRVGIPANVKYLSGQEGRQSRHHGIRNISFIVIREQSKQVDIYIG